MKVAAIWDDWSCQVRVTVTRPEALDPARQHVIALMADVALAVNRFSPDSDLSRINAGAGRLVPVSRRTIELIDVALEAAEQSDGAVDPTVGALVVRAGYDRDISAVRDQLLASPADGSIQTSPADWTAVRIDRTLRRVGVPAGLMLDLGATAKAWTADSAARTIARTFGTAALVEIGGDISVSGPVTTPWQITVAERPLGLGDEPVGQQIGLERGGLATSTTTARRWRTPDGEAHHLIDPRTGRPSEGPWRTATVWAPSAVLANTASTAAIVLGREAEAHLEALGVAARLVDRDGHVRTVGGWPAEAEAA